MPERHNFLLVMVFIASIFASDAQRRVPAGFTGVRGKKSDAEGASPPETLEKRAPSGFMGMRGKKYTFDGELTPEWTYKRAPNGFVGMRGKKEDFSQDFPDEQLKRSPQGFLGMRGKKYDDYELLDDYPKRAPIGFTGLRGKKVIFEKRAPTALGFFGTRGKKYPYEFRGKFVGVRGKKSEGAGRVVDVGDDLDLNQLMLLLTNETGGEKERVVLE